MPVQQLLYRFENLLELSLDGAMGIHDALGVVQDASSQVHERNPDMRPREIDGNDVAGPPVEPQYHGLPPNARTGPGDSVTTPCSTRNETMREIVGAVRPVRRTRSARDKSLVS